MNEDENEMQRKELQRLLGTAKDKDRQELIQNAIHSLSGNHRSQPPSHPIFLPLLPSALPLHPSAPFPVPFSPSISLTMIMSNSFNIDIIVTSPSRSL